jgi:PKD repeat protein
LVAVAVFAIGASSLPGRAVAVAPGVTASFTYAPASPLTGEIVTFSSTSTVTGGNNQIAGVAWDLDGDGSFDDAATPTATFSFPTSGPHLVRLSVQDRHGNSDVVAETVSVQNRPPTVSFVYSPVFPATAKTITFTSTSTDPEGSPITVAWDLDNDGRYDDGTTAVTSHAFSGPGNYTVGLRATDAAGASSTVTRSVAVGNRPPLASLVHSPASPAAGDTVTFVSTASDPDGPIAAQAWDLDGDGSFDDASGPTAARSFTVPGSYTVSLRVVDSGGLVSAASRTIVVRARTAALLTGRGAAPLLSPFPIVRITGRVTRSGIRLRRMIVDAPRGSTVVVRCQGRGCPLRRQVRTAVSGPSAGPLARVSRIVRVRRLERRLLRAGVVLKISVTKPGTIGKYTRFRIRRGRPPARIDRCLMPGTPGPLRCPRS